MSSDKDNVDKIDNDMDWLLQKMASMANDENFTAEVLLTVSGFIISGIIIGGKEYFNLLDCENQEEETNFGEIGRSVYDSGHVVKETIYIHLKHAKFHHPGKTALPSNRGVLWRGKICSVIGFSFGVLGKEPEDR